jgi:hypothetical protein
VTKDEPGGDAANPEIAALERLEREAWRMRADSTGSVAVPLADGVTWRRVRFWMVKTFTGFRYGDDHHAVAAVFLRPAPPRATAESCLHDFESWAGAYTQGMGIEITAPTVTKAPWRGERVAVRAREGSVLWALEKRNYAGVYGSYLPWSGTCLTLGYAFPMREDPALARRVRDRFVEQAFSRLHTATPPPPGE